MRKNSVSKLITLPLLIATITACVLSPVKLESGAELVKVGKQHPGSHYTEVGPISAESGTECSPNPIDKKEVGSYENALNLLKNKAAKENVDYVEVTGTVEPGYKLNCLSGIYRITGTGYRQIANRTIIKNAVSTNKPNSSINTRSVTSQPESNERPVNLEPEINTNTTIAEQLRELHTLKNEGVISEMEYKKLKDKLIDRF